MAAVDRLVQASSDRVAAQSERGEIEKRLEETSRELQRLKRTYPLRDLLSHKESELSRAMRDLKAIQEGTEARKKAESIVATLSEQRDQLRSILAEAEQR
jgi:hypothetical protein